MRNLFKRPMATALALTWVAMACAQTASAERPHLADHTPVSDAQWPDGGENFRFVVVGDRRGGGEDAWPLFDRAVDEINLLRPDFAIMVGDAIEGYSQDPGGIAAEWKDFQEHADRLQVPLFLLPGNHDISNADMHTWWREHVGRTYYSVDYRGCHFLILNTHEHWVENDSSIGPDQVRFAVDDLDRSKTARHTFIFMHVPVWTDPNNAEWNAIEAALGNRPRTVFAGHTHRLTHERRDGNRYMVVATTRGTAPRRDDGILPQLGGFAHYTQVTVDGDKTHVAIIEPGGPMWPEDVAPRAFQEAARNLARVQPVSPLESPDGTFRTGIALFLKNGLPENVDVSLEVHPTGPNGWRPLGDSGRSVTLAPGAEQTLELLFDVDANKVVPVPRVQLWATYVGNRLFSIERNAPLYPESALREMPEWQVIGPFEAGPISGALPDDPRGALPLLFAVRGLERGPVPGTTFDDAGQPLAWQPLKTEGKFLNLARLCETPTCVLAYASCGVYSPSNRTVRAEFRADDYAQIFVNGTGIEDERLFRTRSDATYVDLPLKAGWNTVVVKCVNISGGWTFRLLPADPGTELRFAPNPE